LKEVQELRRRIRREGRQQRKGREIQILYLLSCNEAEEAEEEVLNKLISCLCKKTIGSHYAHILYNIAYIIMHCSLPGLTLTGIRFRIIVTHAHRK